jgi:hypothetical protein
MIKSITRSLSPGHFQSFQSGADFGAGNKKDPEFYLCNEYCKLDHDENSFSDLIMGYTLPLRRRDTAQAQIPGLPL